MISHTLCGTLHKASQHFLLVVLLRYMCQTVQETIHLPQRQCTLRGWVSILIVELASCLAHVTFFEIGDQKVLNVSDTSMVRGKYLRHAQDIREMLR